MTIYSLEDSEYALSPTSMKYTCFAQVWTQNTFSRFTSSSYYALGKMCLTNSLIYKSIKVIIFFSTLSNWMKYFKLLFFLILIIFNINLFKISRQQNSWNMCRMHWLIETSRDFDIQLGHAQYKIVKVVFCPNGKDEMSFNSR